MEKRGIKRQTDNQRKGERDERVSGRLQGRDEDRHGRVALVYGADENGRDRLEPESMELERQVCTHHYGLGSGFEYESTFVTDLTSM